MISEVEILSPLWSEWSSLKMANPEFRREAERCEVEDARVSSPRKLRNTSYFLLITSVCGPISSRWYASVNHEDIYPSTSNMMGLWFPNMKNKNGR